MEEVIAKRAARLARDNHTPEPSDDEMDDEAFNVTVKENVEPIKSAESSFLKNDQLQEELSPFPQTKVTHTPVDRILRSHSNTPKDSTSITDKRRAPADVSRPGSATPSSKSRSATPSYSKNTTPIKSRPGSSTPSKSEIIDLTTPVIPVKARKKSEVHQSPTDPTPAVATRTRSGRNKKESGGCASDFKIPVSLDTPAPTAPSSPSPS